MGLVHVPLPQGLGCRIYVSCNSLFITETDKNVNIVELHVYESCYKSQNISVYTSNCFNPYEKSIKRSV